MHILEECNLVDVVFHFQSTQRGAVLPEESRPQQMHLFRIEAEDFGHVIVHAAADRFPNTRGGRIKRVVQIEEHGFKIHTAKYTLFLKNTRNTAVVEGVVYN